MYTYVKRQDFILYKLYFNSILWKGGGGGERKEGKEGERENREGRNGI